MLILFVAYYSGGGLCGAFLSIWYFRCLMYHIRRVPGSFILGLGWLLFIFGMSSLMHSQYTVHKSSIWIDGYSGCVDISFGFWWVAMLVYLAKNKPSQRTVSDQAQPQPSSTKSTSHL